MGVRDQEADDACFLLGESSSNSEEGLTCYQGVHRGYELPEEKERITSLLHDERILLALRPTTREAFVVLSPAHQVQLVQSLFV